MRATLPSRYISFTGIRVINVPFAGSRSITSKVNLGVMKIKRIDRSREREMNEHAPRSNSLFQIQIRRFFLRPTHLSLSLSFSLTLFRYDRSLFPHEISTRWLFSYLKSDTKKKKEKKKNCFDEEESKPRRVNFSRWRNWKVRKEGDTRSFILLKEIFPSVSNITSNLLRLAIETPFFIPKEGKAWFGGSRFRMSPARLLDRS